MPGTTAKTERRPVATNLWAMTSTVSSRKAVMPIRPIATVRLRGSSPGATLMTLRQISGPSTTRSAKASIAKAPQTT